MRASCAHVASLTLFPGERALRQLLSYTHAPSSDLRSLSIRLVVNKMYADPALLKPILDYARALMARVTDVSTLEDIPDVPIPAVPADVPTWMVYKEQEKKKYEASVAETKAKAQAEAEAAAKNASEGSTAPTAEAVPSAMDESSDTIKVKVEPTADTPATSTTAAVAPSTPTTTAVAPSTPTTAAAPSTPTPAPSTPSDPSIDADRLKELELQWKKHHEKLTLQRHILQRERELAERASKERVRVRQERIGRHLELFFAIATKQQPLVGMVCTLYARANAFVKSCIQKQVRRPPRMLLVVDMFAAGRIHVSRAFPSPLVHRSDPHSGYLLPRLPPSTGTLSSWCRTTIAPFHANTHHDCCTHASTREGSGEIDATGQEDGDGHVDGITKHMFMWICMLSCIIILLGRSFHPPRPLLPRSRSSVASPPASHRSRSYTTQGNDDTCIHT